jgi:XapX domain-containing protein
MLEIADMKAYLISLGAGLLVGVVYSLLHLRSPAPPVIALAGLLGILAGEQIVPLASRYFFPNSTNIASQQNDQE